MEKKAIIFPGQGSQYPNMGLSLYENFEASRKIFSLIDDLSGVKVTEAMFSQDVLRLKDTSIQQLAILAVSLAAYRQVKDNFKDIVFLSGLSLGEYSCLYAAEALSLEDIVFLVKTRAQAMQKAAQTNPSSMFAVIGAKSRGLKEKQKELNFYIANINAPSQVVISVGNENKNKVKSSLEKQELRVVELEVSGGFHSPFMEPARKELKEAIGRLSFSDAKIPIVSNLTAKPHTDSWEIKENLIQQLVSPVLWMDSVKYMAQEGIECFYEIGPSKVLKGILRKIDKSLKVVNIEKQEDIKGGVYGF